MEINKQVDDHKHTNLQYNIHKYTYTLCIYIDIDMIMHTLKSYAAKQAQDIQKTTPLIFTTAFGPAGTGHLPTLIVNHHL